MGASQHQAFAVGVAWATLLLSEMARRVASSSVVSSTWTHLDLRAPLTSPSNFVVGNVESVCRVNLPIPSHQHPSLARMPKVSN